MMIALLLLFFFIYDLGYNCYKVNIDTSLVNYMRLLVKFGLIEDKHSTLYGDLDHRRTINFNEYTFVEPIETENNHSKLPKYFN